MSQLWGQNSRCSVFCDPQKDHSFEMKTCEQIAMGRTDLQLYMSTEPTAILKHQHVHEGGFLVMGLEVIFLLLLCASLRYLSYFTMTA